MTSNANNTQVIQIPQYMNQEISKIKSIIRNEMTHNFANNDAEIIPKLCIIRK